MKNKPSFKKVEVVSGCTARWAFKNLRCSLSASSSGITVIMKGGNKNPGEPGEEIHFFRQCQSLEEALQIVKTLPESFGPKDCDHLGFKKTMWALYD